jgi:hypothetical protein
MNQLIYAKEATRRGRPGVKETLHGIAIGQRLGARSAGSEVHLRADTTCSLCVNSLKAKIKLSEKMFFNISFSHT